MPGEMWLLCWPNGDWKSVPSSMRTPSGPGPSSSISIPYHHRGMGLALECTSKISVELDGRRCEHGGQIAPNGTRHRFPDHLTTTSTALSICTPPKHSNGAEPAGLCRITHCTEKSEHWHHTYCHCNARVVVRMNNSVHPLCLLHTGRQTRFDFSLAEYSAKLRIVGVSISIPGGFKFPGQLHSNFTPLHSATPARVHQTHWCCHWHSGILLCIIHLTGGSLVVSRTTG